MIEAYGARMAAGDSSGAKDQLAAIEAALDDNGEQDFANYWSLIPGRLAKAGPLDEEVFKKMCDLVWWESRRRLVDGERPPTPQFLGENNAIQTRP